MIVVFKDGGWYFVGTGELRNANNLLTAIGGWYFTGTGVVEGL